MRRTLTAAVALGLAFAAPAAASTLIDDFVDAQKVQDAPDATFPTNSRISGGMIGGSRLLQVETDSGSIFPGATNLTSEAGELTFSNDTQETGRAWVVYDGLPAADGMGDPINQGPIADVFDITTGVLGLDLTFGGMFAPNEVWFDFDFDLDLEGPLYFAAAVYDGAEFAFFDEVFPQGGPPVSTLFLSEMALLGGSFNWATVEAIGFFVDSVWGDGGITGGNPSIFAGSRPSFDGGISSITIQVIPLPASALLLLGGLGGFAGVAAMKRRRKAA